MLVRPWLHAMRILGIVPRSVVDDLTVLIKQQQQQTHCVISLAANAMQDTHFYIIAIGGDVKTSKTWAFASDAIPRKVLIDVVFSGNLEMMRVVHEHGDLGAHLCVTINRTGATMAARTTKATQQLTCDSRHIAKYTHRTRLVG